VEEEVRKGSGKRWLPGGASWGDDWQKHSADDIDVKSIEHDCSNVACCNNCGGHESMHMMDDAAGETWDCCRRQWSWRKNPIEWINVIRYLSPDYVKKALGQFSSSWCVDVMVWSFCLGIKCNAKVSTEFTDEGIDVLVNAVAEAMSQR